MATKPPSTTLKVEMFKTMPPDLVPFFEELFRVMNGWMVPVTTLLSGGLSLENLKAGVVEVQFVVKDTVEAAFPIRQKLGFQGRCAALVPFYAYNRTDKSILQTSVTADWEADGDGYVKIKHITGLDVSKSYVVRMLAFAQ